MNSLSEQLLQAVEIVVDEKITKLEYDKTVQGQIYSIVNLDTGEYKVRYSGNIFSAFAEDTSKTYKIDDAVYVKIPEGDMSNRKIITSLVKATSLNEAQLVSLQNSIMEISPTFDELYGGYIYDRSASYGVIAGADPIVEGEGYNYIFQNSDAYAPNGYHGLFQQYSEKYQYIRVKASFLTQFHSTHSKGNYGIEVEFYTKDDSSVSYRLDCSSFNGNPYGFSVYTPQEIILKAQTSYLMGLKSIKLFEEGFDYDKIIYYDGTPDKEITDVANIFVKDIILQYVDVVDLSDTTYYLTIAAPRGIAFTDKNDKVSLVGRLVYQGEDIMSNSKVTCQWYERDLSVMIGDEAYSKSAGFGWRALEDETEDTLALDSSDVAHEQRYKLVVVYNEDIVLTAETEVKNLHSEYEYYIEQVTEGADIKLQLKEKNTTEVLIGNWYLSYPDGSYSSITDGKNQSSVTVSEYLTYSSIVFYCEVYNSEGVYLGTLEHTITNSENEDDVTISYIGDDSFRYDANGDITVEDMEKERTLQVNLAWREGYGTSYYVTWLMRDENNDEVELPNSKDASYSPDDSMLEKIWVDNYNILHYNIKQKYKVNYNNNSIIVRITTIINSIYSFNKEILFLKDGDQGTNGTTYITAIRPCDSNGVKLSGLQPLKYNSGWQNYLRLRCYVYKDGDLINDLSRYNITYKWEGNNVTLENKEVVETSTDLVIARGIPTISADTTSGELAFYAKVQVTVTDTNNDDKVILYASYPLDVIVGSAVASDIDISDVPSYVKYTSSGLTPSYYSNDINFYYCGNTYNDNILSLNTDLLDIIDKDGKKYLEAASSFIFENIKENNESNIGVLAFDVPNGNGRLIHPVIMYLDTYGNEAINGWDGTALDTGNGEYVFAPQVGAGTKDSANRFTGVVMGKDSGQDKIGLYGYQKGVNTFGLMENGTAFFGAKSGGGQITINGTTATISGGGGGDSSIGMTITLADLNPTGATNAIKIGGGKFSVTYNGILNAVDADLAGVIYATSGRIGCTSKYSSDGWIIETNRLYSGTSSSRVELNSNSNETYAIWAGATSSATAASSKFAVSKTGALYAKEGNIGGWVLKSKSFSNSTNTIGMASSGTYTFWSGADSGEAGNSPIFSGSSYFWVKSNGQMSCRNAIIRGSLYADYLSCDNGSIGGWTITSSSLYAGNTYLYSSGRIVASNANISGTINATTLTCNNGTIGGWTITSNSLYAGGTRLQSDGNIYTTYGRVGMVTGSAPGDDGKTYVTYNFGLESTAGDGSVIIQATEGNGNVALRATNWIFLNANKLSCTVDAANQTGIYARFA